MVHHSGVPGSDEIILQPMGFIFIVKTATNTLCRYVIVFVLSNHKKGDITDEKTNQVQGRMETPFSPGISAPST